MVQLEEKAYDPLTSKGLKRVEMLLLEGLLRWFIKWLVYRLCIKHWALYSNLLGEFSSK